MEQLILSRSILLEDTANVIACGEATSFDVGVGHGAAIAYEVIEQRHHVERLRAFGRFAQCWPAAFRNNPTTMGQSIIFAGCLVSLALLVGLIALSHMPRELPPRDTSWDDKRKAREESNS